MTAGAPATLADYRSRVAALTGGPGRPAGPDELVGGLRDGDDPVERAAALLGPQGLRDAAASAARMVEDDGVRYGATEDGNQGRTWAVDPLPVVLGAGEWAGLESALAQRAHLLSALLADVYGARTLLRRGVVPAEVVLAHPGFVRQSAGARSGADPRLLLTATDLARDADGRWTVFADRTATPSGAGYAMVNRRVTSRVLAGPHRVTRLARLRPFFHTMTTALREAAPAGAEAQQVVLLSPGSGSETAYDQSLLATLLGFPLVEADDLAVRDGCVWIRSTARPDRVAVVLRRVDGAWSDPLELRGDSHLGLPGLMEAARRGTVALANPIGTEVLENAGLSAFLPAVCRALLGEDLALPGATTWWCGDDAQRQHVLSRLDTLLVKPIARDRPLAARIGWELDAAERDTLRRRIEAEPWAWAAQEPLAMSTAPVVTDTGLEPRRFVLRTFGVAHGSGYAFLPGGLGRVAPDASSYVVSNSTGAPAKDVWVLDADTVASGWIGDRMLDVRPVRAVAVPAPLAPRAAQALHWLGRYAERAEATARLLRVTDDLVEDQGGWADAGGGDGTPRTPGAAAAYALSDAVGDVTGVPRGDATPADHVRAMVGDVRRPGTVAYAVGRLVRSSQDVRDVLSSDIWHVLSRLERTVVVAGHPDDAPAGGDALQPRLYDVLESSLALSGVVAENMVRDESWGHLDGGMRIERAQLITALVRSALAHDRPPVTDAQVTEAVLEACDSIITHRRRLASGDGPSWPVHSAIGLLLLDPTNPRSVAFQLDRLADDFVLVGDEELARRARELREVLRGVDVDEVGAGDRTALATLCDEVEQELRSLADALAARHFRRKPPQRTVVADWAAPAGSV